MITAKKRAFADAFVSTNNGTQSAIKAGYAPKSAGVAAARLLKDASVAALLAERREKAAAAANITAAKVLARAWEIGNSDARDRGQHLAIAARAFPEFKDAPMPSTQDNRVLILNGLSDSQIDALIQKSLGSGNG